MRGRPTIRDANGTEISETAVGNPYLFTGRRYDAETALYYYRARYYDYYAGRFLQPDPLGYLDGVNLYAYCNNNSVNGKDPMGLSSPGAPPWPGPGRTSVLYPDSVLIVTTQNNGTTRYQLNSATELVQVIIHAKLSGDKITGFEYIGHADPSGGGLIVGTKGHENSAVLNFEGTADEYYPPAINYQISALKDLITEAFDPTATIILAGCGTANGPNSIAADFKEILPDANVYGYTGYARVSAFWRLHWAMKGSQFVEVTSDTKDCPK